MTTILKRIGHIFGLLTRGSPITSINQKGFRLEDFSGEFKLTEHSEAYEIPVALLSRSEMIFSAAVAKDEITPINRMVFESYHFKPFYRRAALSDAVFKSVPVVSIIKRMHLRGLIMFSKKELSDVDGGCVNFAEYGLFCPVIKNDWSAPAKQVLVLVATIRLPKAIHLTHDDTEIEWWTDGRQTSEEESVSTYTLEQVSETICNEYRFVATYSNKVRNIQLYF